MQVQEGLNDDTFPAPHCTSPAAKASSRKSAPALATECIAIGGKKKETPAEMMAVASFLLSSPACAPQSQLPYATARNKHSKGHPDMWLAENGC
jgi:hypothetical protein